jgi:formylglycine-generating enzyme required for sulfatase activity
MNGQGTLIVYATGTGKTADDNPRGRNGLFTSHLLQALTLPGLSLNQVMQQVGREVYRDSGATQTPAIYGLLLEDVTLRPAASRVDAAEEAWCLIKGSQLPEDFEQFAASFPESELAATARLRASQLRRTKFMSLSAGGIDQPRLKVNPHDGLTYVWIAPGTFTMGCSPNDTQCAANEQPRSATVAKGFWIGQTEVTQEAYQRVMGSNPSHFQGPRLPVEQVTWNDARNYCRAVGMRLPVEAEWEYAARAGDATARYGALDSIAWYNANSDKETHEVAQKLANAFGLYDMLGNVREWVDAGTDPHRILRGGSWFSIPANVRASNRDAVNPAFRFDFAGFRCAGD